ncbi:hypothetical protein A35E_00577 [secondary endosymbiont of Heteropsylla cubana]|uniref:Lon protease AAA domain-containing protein n=1 Tax=secondary endosymbiont of Heteropsylla cubana TaxID=134287 RepID=J7GSZ4_9ENTR|nr:HPF/RaiA family ribosome-associated protein [secondary endosymbiont of Heteropsylla cubana]AFP85862.1 hypothetical protein A35E_00577 [secondary endosymbiont of Heteropsylla cubana]
MNKLSYLYHPYAPIRFTILMEKEKKHYCEMTTEIVKNISLTPKKSIESLYAVIDLSIHQHLAKQLEDNFAARETCLWQSCIKFKHLFDVSCYPNTIKLQLDLMHQANGGVLIIGIHSFIKESILRMQLKQMILQQRCDWFTLDNRNNPLVLSTPLMPPDLQLIILGNRKKLADLGLVGKDLFRFVLYGECVSELRVTKIKYIKSWYSWGQYDH